MVRPQNFIFVQIPSPLVLSSPGPLRPKLTMALNAVISKAVREARPRYVAQAALPLQGSKDLLLHSPQWLGL